MIRKDYPDPDLNNPYDERTMFDHMGSQRESKDKNKKEVEPARKSLV